MSTENNLQITADIKDEIDLIRLSAEKIADQLNSYDVNGINNIIYKYIALRNALSAINKIYGDIEGAIKSHQAVLSATLVARGAEDGVTSFKAESGSAFRTVKKSFRITDWEAFSEWVLSTGNIHCVEKRAAKTAIQEFVQVKLEQLEAEGQIADEAEQLPPGLELHQEIEFQFRK